MGYRLASLESGRAVLVDGGHLTGDTARWWDLGGMAGERLCDPMLAVGEPERLHELGGTSGVPDRDHDGVVPLSGLGPPIPRPRQVFAIGLNYRDHVDEMGREAVGEPVVFTKFPSCLVGPAADVEVVGERTDYEVELVAVVGRRCSNLRPDEAWKALAGVTVGQDVSDRRLQTAAQPPQFSLGKSHATFGPTGPAVVSIDLLGDPDDLELTCTVDGEVRQGSRTSLMIAGVPDLVSYLSGICTLEPGDLLFTGTPAGVGDAQGRCLRVGQTVVSEIGGVGRLVNRCV
ncbi:MAG: fumarylacetoacetate hydrolase family protein [Acidimicrobiales bacterium]|jgi:2-keto-4-pentenoate hydratase/2-oxohepta-3-ene-1,7-dioic acid hydratase in catechol pathway|nr:fumarylacetoacetate hydrolase family protein [Acidimicrobiales bacterium]|tara:strand:+ start:3861 stop:4724 length:864 start_codon:yes stop_codon:yes gene_type:complete